MYLEYWSLQRNPFDPVPDSRSFFPTSQHQQALAAISYAACEGGEPVWITGPAGCGKTLLLRALRRQLPPDRYHVVFVPGLSGGQVGLLRSVAYSLTRTVPADTASAMDVVLQTVAEAERCQRSIVIMLDDWPAAPRPEAFDELRWFLNLDIESIRACVLFTGEPGNPQTQWPEWLRQRLFTTAGLGPLQPQQVPPYLEHRLRAAGHPQGTLFSASAAAVIAEWSGCVPRLVNRLAHLALHVAHLQQAQRIDEDAVRQAIGRLTGFEPTSASGAEAAGVHT